MPHDSSDMARLWDMLDAARAITGFIRGIRFDEFLKDRRTRNAVERNLEIIGEAARNVSVTSRLEHPGIPWRSIVGLRNAIAHEYGEILYENLWGICVNRIPELIARLERMGAGDAPADSQE